MSKLQEFNYHAMGNRLSFIDNDLETRYTPNNVNRHIRRHVGWAGEYRRCSGEAQDTRAGVSSQHTDISAATSPPDGGWRYDARGNLRSDGTRKFRWDGEDRLTRADVPNAAEGKQRVDYTYDSKSRRVIRKQGREHTLYIYDQWNCIAGKRDLSVLDEARRVRFSTPRESNQYTVDGQNSDSLLTTRYVWGTDLSGSLQHRDLSGADGDEVEVEARRVRYAMNRMSNQRAGRVGGLLHADQVTNGQGQTKGYYFHYDGNGNVTAVTNAKGRRAASYTYDAFGNTLEAKGNYADQNSYRLMLLARRPPLGPPYGSPSRSARFSTKPLDEVTGFYYYGYRHYDPVTGRWPSRDPIEERGGVNLHGMVKNDLISQWDYLGLEFILKIEENDQGLTQHLVQGRSATNSVALTVVNRPKVSKSIVIEETEDKKCAWVKEAPVIDVRVDVRIADVVGAFYATHGGRSEIVAHEMRRVDVWMNAYYGTFGLVGSNLAKACGMIERDQPGKAKEDLTKYISDLIEEAYRAFLDYGDEQSSEIDNENFLFNKTFITRDGFELFDGFEVEHEVADFYGFNPPSCP